MEDLHKSIHNRLDDSDFYDRVIDAYSDISRSFYASIINYYPRKNNPFINDNDKSKFYKLIFNIWKNHIIYASNNLNYINGVGAKKEIQALADYLKNINPESYIEIEDILEGNNINDELLKRAINRFRFNRCGEKKDGTMGDYTHIDYLYLSCGLIKRNDIEHRLYINCGPSVMYKFLYELSLCLQSKKKNFYFKFDENNIRDDTIIIYTNSDELEEYIDIIKNIINNNNDIKFNINQPPLLTGDIDGIIGYGMQPDNNKESYSTKRCKHLEDSIDNAFRRWLRYNINNEYYINNRSIRLYEVILNYIINKQVELYGQTNNSYYKGIIERIIKDNWKEVLDYYLYHKEEKMFTSYYNNDIYQLSSKYLDDIRKIHIKDLYYTFDDFKDEVKESIVNTTYVYDIDYSNYSFNADIFSDNLYLDDIEEFKFVSK